MKLFYPGRCLLAWLTVVFLINSQLSLAQSSATFSFNAIPYSDPDFIAPGRGAEQWHNGTGRITYPTESSNLESLDVYYRFAWNKLEGATQGSYTWTYFDNLVKDAINKGQKLSFGIMTHRSDNGDGFITYDGARSGYPQYVHNLMQSESVKDYIVGGVWVPNWNSAHYVGRLRALHQAIADRLKTTSYRPTSGPNAGKNVLFKDAIYCIDIRGFGNWGEWHTGDIGSWNSLKVKPTAQALINIINAHTEVFDEWPLSMMVAAFDGGVGSTDLFAPYPEVAHHALTTRNKWGAIGYRRDQWGATDGYLNRLLAGNNQTYNGSPAFKTLILEKYKYAPVTGEPMPTNLDMVDLENQVNQYRATSIGNGNYGAQPGSTVRENIRKGLKRTGYRIELTGGSATASSSDFTVKLDWKNIGVAPTYEDWVVTYELRNGSTVVWSGNSTFKPKLFLPSTTATTATDVFNRTGIPQGTYSLYVTVKESSGYRQPLPLAIKGRGSDGSYLLTNSINIPAASGTNQAPVAHAGTNQTITLPTSSAKLTASGSTDADGSISSYLWQQVSGPSTSTLSATNSADITVSNLQAGVYTYRVTVTDNSNATASATVTVTVNAAANQPPTADAGSHRTITLPTSTATLNGSGTDEDGSIERYNWQQISGPSTSTLSATNTANITVSNLQAGVYTYRLTVTDNGGANATATVTVTVNAAANQAPTADAGSNRTITLPTSTATLNGSGTDEDGSIERYDWQQVSGPSTSTLSATNTARITVSDLLIAGVYTYRLTVTDDDGATATATVTVTVNAAANQPPVASAGANRIITLPVSTTTLNGSGTDEDGTISGYKWEQLSGPSTATLSANNTASITVSNLQAGVYTFRVSVTDNDGATATDTVTITVNAAANVAPVADAGANRTITLPTSTATLDGSSSSDADGTITEYRWTQVSGPSDAIFSSTNTPGATVSDLQAGVYRFRLTVTDNDNATDNDEVTVTVNSLPSNQLPVASAGTNRTITLPVNSIDLDGSGSSDADGNIVSYLWEQLSGPATANLSATNTAGITAGNLEAGIYSFRLTVTDNDNANASDVVTVTVNAPANQAPVANAGSSIAITLPTNTATLNGAASSDADGTISSYLWQQVSGPTTSVMSATNTASITVSSLEAGVYTYRLIVTDNDDATHTDLVSVTVNTAAVNRPPTANAGSNRTITLPTNSASLNGSGSSDGDGTIVSYEWQQVSGPSATTFSATDVVSVVVSNLQAGVYTYRLTVTDNDGGTGNDVVTITVNPAPNQAPSVNAGPNRVITLPINSTTLDGSGSSDADGTIASYRWQQVSGPSTSTLSATNSEKITVSNLIAGTYSFRLTVTDDDNASRSDVVTVTVNPLVNQAPVANAGANRTITLPTASTTLNGSASADPDGSITSYQWSQVNGPAAATFSATNTANVSLSNLQAGVYTFRLTVRDNNNATDTDDVTVVVNAAPNQAPVANAGVNKTITLPASTTSLSGAASSDPDGTITSYQWRQVSGPSTATMSATNTAGISLSGLQAGVYTFRLTVRDNNNASASDDVDVIVNPAPNQAPIAEAGPNRTITLPANTSSLSGGASSDPDGNIVSYQWQQVSGPSTAVLSATNTVDINVSNLQAGVYTFRLTVRDNSNATATDDVRVTVKEAANLAPVANAGASKTITLPTNSTSLSGAASSDPDGTIASYQWQQVSGPATATLSAATNVSTSVSNLQAGVYTFRLTVRDNKNASASATVTVTVNAAPNRAPVANAGADRVITLPSNKTTLSGSASSDPDGTITSYQWQQISGPSTSTLSATTGVSITASNLIAGVYNYRLTVTDNKNATATATVKVTVNNASNRAPVANAGADQVIVVTANTTTLDASASTDPDGTIASYTWKQVSGPSASTMSATTGATINVSNLVVGDYVYSVTVKDNQNATATATVKVTVIDNFRSLDKPVSLYPNPAADIVNIRLLNDKAERLEISVYDLSGKVVLPKAVVNKPSGAYTTSIDVTRLKQGSYIIQIASFGTKKTTAKFLKL